MSLLPHGRPPAYLTFASLGALGVPHALTTRHCPGISSAKLPASPFTEEGAAVLAAAGLGVARLAYARQVHGAASLRVVAPGLAGSADILVSTERAQPLAIFTADCLAVTLIDLAAPVVAVAHLGWRGTVRGGAEAAVAALRSAGGDPGRVRATVSPSIGPCCYEVDEPVIAAFSSAYPARWERWVRPGRPGHWMLDLWRANEELLAGAGVPRGAVDNPRTCTACHLDLFYSYRRGDPGRLVTIAALP